MKNVTLPILLDPNVNFNQTMKTGEFLVENLSRKRNLANFSS